MKLESRRLATGMFTLLVAAAAHGEHPRITLGELARSADLVVAGVAAPGSPRLLPTGTIVTDTRIDGPRLFARSPRAIWREGSPLVVTQAGGEIGGRGVEVSGVPHLVPGETYLLFLRDDGAVHATPVVGGEQGMFVLKPDLAGEPRVHTAAGRPVIGVDGEGRVLAADLAAPAVDLRERRAPVAMGAEDAAATRVPDRIAGLAASMSLRSFLDARSEALGEAKGTDMLRWDGRGSHVREGAHGELVYEELPASRPTRSRPEPPAAGSTGSLLGGPLGACGYHNLYLVMEQVPTSWWSYPINNDSMWVWNRFMDVYQYTPDDGSFGDNGENEFCGWVDGATLQSVYGFTWGGAYAMTITWYYTGSPCGEITQADVLWNPAYSWTSSFTVSLGNPNVFLLRPVDMHEIGHTWGEQRGGAGWGYPETLDYDVLSVMHRYHHDLVETGWGIHASDAYLIRRIYQNQTAIVSIVDVGVESYYASNGLHNATTDRGSYVQGDPIVIQDITVENMGYAAASDVRLRLYLSTDRNVTPADTQLGNYWFWTTFNAESYWTGDTTTTIPASVPPGTYYVGAIVTVNGFGNDQFGYNNATTLYGTVTVTPSTVVADFSGTPTTGQAPLPVSFTDLSTSNPTSWLWDFGDGTTSTQQHPSHTYASGGRFTVTLTATSSTSTDTETKVDYVQVLATEEIVAGPGPDAGNAPVVTTWDHGTPPGQVGSFAAYGAPQFGVNVAMAGIEASGVAEVLTGPGPGAIYGPQIRAFQPTGTAIQKVNFYAYGTLRYGAHPGGSNVDGDGHEEILTSPGPGAVFGPHIRGWNYDGAALGTIAKINFFAYATLRYGARVAGGDTDADAYGEIVTGAGAGAVFGPHVRGWNYDATAVSTTAVNLFAFPSGQYGASVATGDTDGDGRDTIVACHGPDPAADAEVRGFDHAGGVSTAWILTTLTSPGGAEAASGDLDLDGVDEVVVAQGWGAANPSTITGFEIAGATGNAIPGLSFDAYAGQSFGAKVAMGDTGTP